MKKIILLLFVVFIAFTAMAQDGDMQLQPLKKHLYYLASDELEGRGAGTEGIDLAAEYIAAEFEDIGLTSSGNDGGYFQDMEITIGIDPGPGNTLKMNEDALEFERMFVPLGFSESTEVKGQLVFAGYGITAKEHNYNDFQNIDINDKVALILLHEPGEKDSASVFDGLRSTQYSDVRSKAISAKANGAAAVILVSGPMFHQEDEALPEIQRNSGYQSVGIPVVQITRRALDDIMGNNLLLKLQTKIEKKLTIGGQAEFEPVAVEIAVDLKRRPGKIRNVIGTIPGSVDSLMHKPLIIGAHYDHLGYGGLSSRMPGSHEVHNGADDNASGVAALIETARLLKNKAELKRSVILIAFSGEEIGLLGSSYYVNNAGYDISGAVAMLNMDTIGRMVENKLIIFGGGTAKEWDRALNGLNYGHRFDLTVQMDGYGPSDQASFYAKDVPVLHFFTGANADYHKPGDDAHKINYKDLSRITNFVSDLSEYLANRENALTLTKTLAYDESETGKTRAGGHGGQRPWFGSVPDFAYQKGDGLRLNGVSPGSPCEKAGISAGDIIIQIDDIEIKSIYELNQVLKSRKPEDIVKVVFIRDGMKQNVDLKLKSR